MELSPEATKLLAKIKLKPVELYWGRGGWRPSYLPVKGKLVHMKELIDSGYCYVELAQLKAK